MPLSEFFKNARRLLTTINRPNWKTYSLSVKIVFAGVGIIGFLGYIIRLISTTLQM
jgi:protein translocase SEC61 complex gamma subunit